MSLKQIWLQKARDVIRLRHYALSTEENYLKHVERFWDAALKMPKDWTREQKMEAFLTAEAKRGCAASSQNQVFCAIKFFFVDVMKAELGNVNGLRAKRPPILRIAPTQEQTWELLGLVPDIGGYPTRLIAHLLYGCGLRVNEPLNLRIKDVDIERRQLRLWGTKGSKARVVTMPEALVDDIAAQVEFARAMWERDQRTGMEVQLPGLLRAKARGYARSWGWFWLFPAHKPCQCPRSGRTVRWRCHEANVQRAVKAAAEKVGLGGTITPHNLRHAYATHVIERGGNVCDLQIAMGHKYLETTQGYVHSDGLRVRSPLDAGAVSGRPNVVPFVPVGPMRRMA